MESFKYLPWLPDDDCTDASLDANSLPSSLSPLMVLNETEVTELSSADRCNMGNAPSVKCCTAQALVFACGHSVDLGSDCERVIDDRVERNTMLLLNW